MSRTTTAPASANKSCNSNDTAEDKSDAPKPRAQDVILRELETTDQLDPWRASDGTPMATLGAVSDHPHLEVLDTPGSRFASAVRAAARRGMGFTPGRHLVSDVIGTIQGMALDGSVHEVVRRVGGSTSEVLIDLMDGKGSVLRIDATGKTLVSIKECGDRFVRPDGSEALPMPAPGGRIDELLDILNIQADHLPLVAAWLVVALVRGIPAFILRIEGGHGTAKTTLTRGLRLLTDPHTVNTTSPPRDERHLAALCKAQRVVALENVSGFSPPMSDALCCVATGNSFSCRSLYTNTGLHSVKVCQPLILNGIAGIVDRPDLADRCITLRLRSISKRRAETDVRRELEDAQPRLFGVLVDALSVAVCRFPEVCKRYTGQPDVPRMFDAACWAEAAAPAFGWRDGYIMDALIQNRAETMLNDFSEDPVVLGVALLVTGGDYEETPQEAFRWMSDRLSHALGRVPSSFPKSPQALSRAIQCRSAVLERLGIVFRSGKTGGDNGQRIWTFERIQLESVARDALVATGVRTSDESQNGDADEVLAPPPDADSSPGIVIGDGGDARDDTRRRRAAEFRMFDDHATTSDVDAYGGLQ